MTVILALLGCVVLPPAPRPVLSGPEQTVGTASGHFLIHYTLAGGDAADPAVVGDFALGLDAMWSRASAAGWTAPPPDAGAGGDGRLDVYVRELDSMGQAHPEPAPGGTSTWIELSPRVGQLGHVLARAVAAHQAHHAFELALAGGSLEPWIYEATATWEELSLYDLYELQGRRDVLWSVRLAGAARPQGDTGGDFESGGMIFLKFLADATGGEAMVVSAWQKMARAGSVRAGLEQALAAPAFAGGLAEAFTQYAVWNQFACLRSDGHHYAPSIACTVPATVSELVAPGYPLAQLTSAPVGALGAMYLVLFPACDKEKATVHLDLGTQADWRIARLLVWSGRSEETLEPLTGNLHDTVVPFESLQRGVIVVANVGTQPDKFRWSIDVDGSYPAPTDPGRVTSIYLDPAPSTLIAGQHKQVAVRARYGTCDNGTDLTAEASFASSAPEVASFEGGLVQAHAAGSTRLTASARGKQTGATLVVGAAPQSGCAVGPPQGPPAAAPALMVLLLGLGRVASSRPSRAAGRARRRACDQASAEETLGGRSASAGCPGSCASGRAAR